MGRSRPHHVGSEGCGTQKMEQLNPYRLKYGIIFTGEETVAYGQTQMARLFVEEKEAL